MDAHTIEAPRQASPSRIAVGRSRRRGLSRALACVAGAFLFGAVAHAAPLTVPNGDFSNTGNHGSVGGGVIGANGTALIGTGPWSATYAGALGALVPPTITVGGGQVQITGLLGVDALGVVNNHAHIHQDTGIAWVANRRYVLSADVNANALLGLSLFTSGNAGVALSTSAASGSRVVSSIQPGATLTLLNGTTYRVSVEYTTGASVSGNIHTHLFAEPSGLLTAQLAGSVAFDNVTLTTHLVNQVPASIVPASPGPYTGSVGQPITPAIGITVLDALGDPILGRTVTFTTPSSGASATVSPNPATTNASGVASVTTTANTIAGSYQITALVSGSSTPLVFNMVNAPGAPSGTGPISGGNQSAMAGQPFAAPIGFVLHDAFGNAVPGVQVTFSAPSTGASATFSPSTVASGPTGQVTTTATANTVAGTYNVSISIAGVATPITFPMTNSAGPVTGAGPISGGNQSAIAGQPFAAPIGFAVHDAFGNPVPGVQVGFIAPSTGASATFNPATVTSGPNGQATTSATANAVAGSYTVIVTISGIPTAISFPLTNSAGNAVGAGPITGGNQNAVVGQAFSGPISFVLQDVHGNPVPGALVGFVAPSSGASASFSPATVTSSPTGQVTTNATANTIAGTYTVTVTVAGVPTPITFPLTNDAGAAASIGPITGGGQSAQAGQPFATAVSFLVRDAFDNAVPGVSVTFSAPSSGASATFNPATVTSSTTGQVTTNATANTVAGTYDVTVSIAGITTPVTFPLTNTAGPAASIDTATGSGQTPIAGQPFAAPLGLRVLDAFGNVVPGVTVTFSAPSTGASAALSPTSVTTGVNGTATTTAIANGIAGEYHITASIPGLGQVGQYAVTNMLDPSIDPDPAGETTLNGSLGGLFSCVLLVQVTDAQDNPLQGLEVDFTAPISGPTATLTDGNSSGFSVRTTTDEDGFAWVEATGNGVAGSYTVNAQLRYSSQAAIPFRLRNLDALDPVFNAGFDGTCIPAVGLLQAQQPK